MMAEHEVSSKATNKDARSSYTNGRYASVNGLNLYYEIYDAGEPLILLHGGVGAIEMFAKCCPPSPRTDRSSPSICKPMGALLTSIAR